VSQRKLVLLRKKIINSILDISNVTISKKIDQVTYTMLNQFPTTAVGIVFLILAILLLFLFNWVAVLLIDSKETARKKKGACFLTALIGVLMFILVLWVWGKVFGAIPVLIPAMQWPDSQPLLALGPMIVFLLYILLVHGLIGSEWKKAVWISILALLLLAVFLAFTPYVAQYLTFYPMNGG